MSARRQSAKAIRYWQIASMVVEEDGEAHTINLCQQCYHEKRTQETKQPLKLWQWRGCSEQEGATWKDLDGDGKRTISGRNVRVSYS